MNTRTRVTTSVLFVAVMIFLFWFAEQPVAVGLLPAPFDKVVHALMGAGIAFLLWFAFAGKFGWLIIALVAVLSGLEEWHQRFLPGRVPDVNDFLAATGAAILCIIWLRLRKRNNTNL